MYRPTRQNFEAGGFFVLEAMQSKDAGARGLRRLKRSSLMSDENKIATEATRLGLSLDVWAVITAFLLALLVRVGVLKHVPW
jgi:hypothetical protein